ncbi:MAG: hypothetical protein KAW89_01485, partial [Armatimonadetes bacterium]|nr:hypothetical protein [Armatimonadota bacterium]
RMEIWKHPDRSRSWKWWLLHCLYTTGELVGMGRTLEAMFQKPKPECVESDANATERSGCLRTAGLYNKRNL